MQIKCVHYMNLKVTFHSLMNNLHFTYLIFILNHLRARFESLCGNLIQKCVALIDDVCAKANVSSSDIEKVSQTETHILNL